ncbi:uncharacterized protein H6S33_002492 [Morchella sextelata]|uniref:uncharacterized protein n=1 Tax=Morchella sextelata TaxID=1174677 RepID=UPI001D04104F|nr:uncharacterized protein H6S33_002492 [Morchella sextelata]KAH0607458.1 hypothetical protein H6S33_002492 [Morchella sextelata]
MYISAPLHTPFPPSYPHAHAPAHVSLRRRLITSLKDFAQRRLPPRLARFIPRSTQTTAHAAHAYYTTPEIPLRSPERGRTREPKSARLRRQGYDSGLPVWLAWAAGGK